MTGHELKIWMVTHHHTQVTLAKALGVTVRSISTYCNNKPPKVVVLALKGLIEVLYTFDVHEKDKSGFTVEVYSHNEDMARKEALSNFDSRYTADLIRGLESC